MSGDHCQSLSGRLEDHFPRIRVPAGFKVLSRNELGYSRQGAIMEVYGGTKRTAARAKSRRVPTRKIVFLLKRT
jgi:hypothetical protein